jgi:hypothetical protein
MCRTWNDENALPLVNDLSWVSIARSLAGVSRAQRRRTFAASGTPDRLRDLTQPSRHRSETSAMTLVG